MYVYRIFGSETWADVETRRHTFSRRPSQSYEPSCLSRHGTTAFSYARQLRSFDGRWIRSVRSSKRISAR